MSVHYGALLGESLYDADQRKAAIEEQAKVPGKMSLCPGPGCALLSV